MMTAQESDRQSTQKVRLVVCSGIEFLGGECNCGAKRPKAFHSIGYTLPTFSDRREDRIHGVIETPYLDKVQRLLTFNSLRSDVQHDREKNEHKFGVTNRG